MVRTADGRTIVTIHVEGLDGRHDVRARTSTTQACADGDADGHYRFDPAGAATPPNEIWPGPVHDERCRHRQRQHHRRRHRRAGRRVGRRPRARLARRSPARTSADHAARQQGRPSRSEPVARPPCRAGTVGPRRARWGPTRALGAVRRRSLARRPDRPGTLVGAVVAPGAAGTGRNWRGRQPSGDVSSDDTGRVAARSASILKGQPA